MTVGQVSNDQTTPELSIIIVSYNSAEYLPVCLDSLAGAASVTYEVLVVDNCSSDRTVEKLAPRYPAVRWITNQQNVGFGPANNIGLQETTGRMVLFLNPDTRLPPLALDSLCQAMNRLPQGGCLGPKLLNTDGSFQRTGAGRFITLWTAFLEFFPLWRLASRFDGFYGFCLPESVRRTCTTDWVSGAALLARRQVLDKVGGFAGDLFLYFEDMDLCQRIRRAGYLVYYVPEISITHCRGKSMGELNLEGLRQARDSIRGYMYKQHGRLWFQAFRLVVLLGCLARVMALTLAGSARDNSSNSIRSVVRMAQLYL